MTTDMLTPSQFKDELITEGRTSIDFSEMAFIIGSEKHDIELSFDPEEETPEKPFIEVLQKHGLTVKKVDSLNKLDGKTGFILYGYYPIDTIFGHSWEDYHVVRVNPNKTFVEYDSYSGGPKYAKVDDDGSMGGYSSDSGSILFFKLIEEKNKDTEKNKNRINSVFARVKGLLDGELISEDEKADLKIRLQALRAKLVSQKETIFSNYVNILLEEVLMIVQEYEQEFGSSEPEK